MLIAQVQFAPWDKVYNFSVGDLKLSVRDQVVVETDLGMELGRIVAMFDEDLPDSGTPIKNIWRLASADDLARVVSPEEKDAAIETCRGLIERHGLPMKLVDAHFSWEGNRLNFAFVADGRIDFRELVKDLAAHFSANIRLTQIGTRDEARLTGDCGPCGRKLCCQGHIREFSSISSEMAEAQQVVHRGSDRISGMCGRLMCCLQYEYDGYKEMDKELPPVGTNVNVDGRRGVVTGHHILKQTVDVRLQPEKAGDNPIMIEIDPNRKKKKKN